MKRIILSLLLFAPALCMAQPEVIFDSGETKDISNYLYPFAGPDKLKEHIEKRRMIKTPEELKKEFEAAKKRLHEKRIKNKEVRSRVKHVNPMLPLNTGGLVLGRVRPRSVNFPEVKKPICIFGSDKKSLRWFNKIKYDIQEEGGYCWLIQAETADDLKKVLKHSKGIVSVVPITGELAVKRFGIKRYPVIITSEEITQ